MVNELEKVNAPGASTRYAPLPSSPVVVAVPHYQVPLLTTLGESSRPLLEQSLIPNLTMKSFIQYATALAVAVLPVANAAAPVNTDEYCTTRLTAALWTSAVPTYTLTTITKWTTKTLTSTDLSYTTFTPDTATTTSTSTSMKPSNKIVNGAPATVYTTRFIPYTTTSTYTPPVSTSWSTIETMVTWTPDPVTDTATKFVDTVAYETNTKTVVISSIITAPTSTATFTVTPAVRPTCSNL